MKNIEPWEDEYEATETSMKSVAITTMTLIGGLLVAMVSTFLLLVY